MIRLDYQRDSSRWGSTGIVFHSWEQYALTLGYLSNIIHYRNSPAFKPILEKWDRKIEVHVEENERTGIRGKEGGIYYFGLKNDMKAEFPDLYKCKSAGDDGITLKFCSTEFIYSLVNDYHFSIYKAPENTVTDIFPPLTEPYDQIWNVLEMYLLEEGMEQEELQSVKKSYKDGWNK